MALKDINKDLHQRKSKFAQREHEKTIYNTQSTNAKPSGTFVAQKTWSDRIVSYSKAHVVGIISGLAALAVIVVISFLVVSTTVYQRSFFKQDKVAITITGPQSVSGNTQTLYTINYDNDNRAALKDVDFLLRYSDNFQPENSESFTRVSSRSGKIHLDRIDSKTDGTVKIKGKFFGPRNHVVTVGAVMRYTPESTSVSYEKSASIVVNVTSSPVTLDVRGPIDAADGDEITYTITYKNTGTVALEDQRIIATLPKGFTTLTTQPRPSAGKNIWYIGTIAPGEEGEIRMSGVIEGLRDEIKTLDASIGTGSDENFTVYNRSEDILRVVAPSLVLRQSIDSSTVTGDDVSTIHAGQNLTYRVTYRNDANVGLRDAIIIVTIDTDILDLKNLQLNNSGSLGKNNTEITWKAVDVPELAFLEPGASGSVDFSVPVRQSFPITDLNDRNFFVKTVAKMDSPDVPTPVSRNKIIASNTLVLNASSPIALSTQALYFDENLPGTGPLPPVVGKETVYTIVWSLTNPSNAITDTTVRASLPTGVVWKGVIRPQNENITFNKRTNEVIWNIGHLDNGVGVIGPQRTVRFQVGLTPSIDQLNKAPNLITHSTVQATDVFTSEVLTRTEPSRNVGLSQDLKLIDAQRSVVEIEVVPEESTTKTSENVVEENSL